MSNNDDYKLPCWLCQAFHQGNSNGCLLYIRPVGYVAHPWPYGRNLAKCWESNAKACSLDLAHQEPMDNFIDRLWAFINTLSGVVMTIILIVVILLGCCLISFIVWAGYIFFFDESAALLLALV
jgi:hypothetical protein